MSRGQRSERNHCWSSRLMNRLPSSAAARTRPRVTSSRPQFIPPPRATIPVHSSPSDRPRRARPADPVPARGGPGAPKASATGWDWSDGKARDRKLGHIGATSPRESGTTAVTSGRSTLQLSSSLRSAPQVLGPPRFSLGRRKPGDHDCPMPAATYRAAWTSSPAKKRACREPPAGSNSW